MVSSPVCRQGGVRVGKRTPDTPEVLPDRPVSLYSELHFLKIDSLAVCLNAPMHRCKYNTPTLKVY